MDARKTTVQNQRVTGSFQRAPATTDVVVHKARKLGRAMARGAPWAHACSVHNRVKALRSSRGVNARKPTQRNQRVTVSFQRAPATTDVVVHKARKLGASRGARGALWAHASSVHNRVNALRSSARDGRTKNHCAESTSYSEFPESTRDD